jgi:hypothetical protein
MSVGFGMLPHIPVALYLLAVISACGGELTKRAEVLRMIRPDA